MRGADSMKDAVLIVNPTAGGGRAGTRHLKEARGILSRGGIETSLRPTIARGDAMRLARDAVAEGREMVIVCGGDGTINETVNGLARSSVPMAVLPSGTANILAKELHLPWDVRKAAALIPTAKHRRIALGLLSPCNNGDVSRYFLCVGGAGPDGVLVYSLNPGLKLKTGILSYWMEGFRQLFRYQFPRFQVISSDRKVEASLVVVGRTRNYGGPFQITTGANLFEDAFEVVAVTTRSPLRYLSYLPALWLGYLRRLDGVHTWKTAELDCQPSAEGVAYAQVDGEPSGRLGVKFSIVPDALTLIVPERP
jgi:YegS/Rv2252/BmrU family lipid kinase